MVFVELLAAYIFYCTTGLVYMSTNTKGARHRHIAALGATEQFKGYFFYDKQNMGLLT